MLTLRAIKLLSPQLVRI